MSGKEVAQASDPDFRALADKLTVEAATVRPDTKRWIEEKVGAIAASSSLEEINALAEAGGISSKDLVGHMIEFKDAVAGESAAQYKEQNNNNVLGKVLLVDGTDLTTGEEIQFTGGGDTFVSQVTAVRDNIGFPQTGTLMSKAAGAGDIVYVKWLVKRQG